MKSLDTGVLHLQCLTLKIKTKAIKTKQCSKETCLHIIVLLYVTINTSIKLKLINNTKRLNVNNDVYLYGDFVTSPKIRFQGPFSDSLL